jgi:hypothetical protein
MNERFISAYEETLAANKSGEVKNLLITDGDSLFLDDAQYALRRWVLDKGFHLVEIDEESDDWLPEIQSRELFYKLSVPNTVLLVRNYAITNWDSHNENTPRNFLRDAALNRHYGCGNDFVPSDELPNLLFVVALNGLSEMYWEEKEFSHFTIIHKDENKTTWMNVCVSNPVTQMHPVMSRENKELYRASADGKDLRFKVVNAFRGLPRRPLRRNAIYDEIIRMREEHIHLYLEKNRPDFSEQVENLILRGNFLREDDTYKLDAERLLAVFPNLKTVCCHDHIAIENAPTALRVFDPFELGEYSFELARAKNFEAANRYFIILRALDSKWTNFWWRVAIDYKRLPEDHSEFDPYGPMVYNGMDDLFKVYLLGWYPKGLPIEVDFKKVCVEKHKNFKKAIELLPVRFQNCDLHEIGEKFFWDLQYVETDENPDYEGLANVILAAEKIIPNVRQGFFELVQYYGCEECSSSLILKQLLEGSKTKG